MKFFYMMGVGGWGGGNEGGGEGVVCKSDRVT